MSPKAASLLVFLAALTCAGLAHARSSDRNQPMDIEAGHSQSSLNDDAPTVLSGGVHVVQGSLDVHSDRAVISTRNGDPTRAVLTGTPVLLKQQMDDGTLMNARASKVDYDLTTEIVVFTGAVQIQQPRGSLSGERVVYDMKSGQVESGGGQGAGRVRMRILPRGARPATETPAAGDQPPPQGGR